jgi:plastocyanin
MSTRDRFTRVGSRWGTVTVGAALGMLLGTSPVAAASPAPSVGVGEAGLTATAATRPAGPRIEITKHAFSLPTVTVPAGATVTWINRDDDAHTVVSTTALFRSPGLDTDDGFSYRFTKPGTYPYFCTLHPLMVGTVIVR